MDQSPTAGIQDTMTLLSERGAKFVHVGLTDLQGQLRGKVLSVEHFISALHEGFSITHNLHTLVCGDRFYPVEGYQAGRSACFTDALARIVPESCRTIPWEAADRNLFFLMEHSDQGTRIDPRCLYGKMWHKALSMGLHPVHACELEFRLLEETPKSAQEKSYRALRPVSASSDYLSTMRQSIWSEFFAELMDATEKLSIHLEAAHWEYAKGAVELIIKHSKGVRAGDDAVIFKTFAKAFAQRKGVLMTFMARPFNGEDGQSCHIHLSLVDDKGRNVFYDSGAPDNMSSVMRHFLGGLQRYSPELLLAMVPNVNSFRRLSPNLFSPVASTWAVDNRSVAFRVIAGNAHSQRIENRIPGADVNPYLALACTLGAGLLGIEEGIEPSDPIKGNAYEQLSEVPTPFRFPETYREAIERFRQSSVARHLFGEEFIRLYSEPRSAHELEFRSLVTDLEVEYLLENA